MCFYTLCNILFLLIRVNTSFQKIFMKAVLSWFIFFTNNFTFNMVSVDSLSEDICFYTIYIFAKASITSARTDQCWIHF